MRKTIFFVLLVVNNLCYAGITNNPATVNYGIDPANTFIFFAGVLKWQDPSLASFNDQHRKDEEFYRLLLSKGVKKENTVFLKDGEATLDKMMNSLTELLKKTTANSTFIFYYAGHGVRSGNNPVCFANYDYNGSSGNGFKAGGLSDKINLLFKGNQIWLLADCCFSGALMEEAQQVSVGGKSVISFTSSSSSNISTGNWTFTQTMIDCFSGLPICDRNVDGKISLGEVKTELFDAMKYREKQLSGTVFYNIPESETFAIASAAGNKTKKYNYLYFQQNNKFEPARVTGENGGTLTGELYHYSDKVSVTVPVAKTKSIDFADFSAGMNVQVEWKGKLYPATIKEAKNGFHYIHYTGYDDSWNEWVMYDRIYTNDQKKCSIEWQGKWYPGDLIQQKNGKYFVHYTGFGNDWDEWVGQERVKL